ncbi:hypothetical protein EK904_009954 [Melospiza melodia maxima]|nr:hypothetical protein EK904_009954 [Melospiza melodia maxima]
MQNVSFKKWFRILDVKKAMCTVWGLSAAHLVSSVLHPKHLYDYSACIQEHLAGQLLLSLCRFLSRVLVITPTGYVCSCTHLFAHYFSSGRFQHPAVKSCWVEFETKLCVTCSELLGTCSSPSVSNPMRQ